MRIGVAGSMHHTERMIEARDILVARGHQAFVTSLAAPFVGRSDDEKERIKIQQKNNQDAIREFWRLMQGADALLVMNLERHGIPHYIGGNTLMEMGFAHILDQKIFLFNPVPDIKFYKSEIEAMKPVIINGDYAKISLAETAT